MFSKQTFDDSLASGLDLPTAAFLSSGSIFELPGELLKHTNAKSPPQTTKSEFFFFFLCFFSESQIILVCKQAWIPPFRGSVIISTMLTFPLT